MRAVFLASITVLLAGCASSGGMRTINSTPPGALVTVEGYGECETPCTIKLDGSRHITVAKAGYKAQRFYISPDGQPVEVILELAAPAGEVDETSLPAID
ncbi:MAG: hypothetical protein DHS20C05_09890 [Hyphococcus sp.]|nr:MAG: hypothetical protein DHS20C05_09890 [Marinicaulis sp.]